MKQSKADPCVFRKVVDEEVTLIVCVHVGDLAVEAKSKETLDEFYAQLREELPLMTWVIYLGTLSAPSSVI